MAPPLKGCGLIPNFISRFVRSGDNYSHLRSLGASFVLAWSAQLTSAADAGSPQLVVIPAMQKDLADVPGKEMVMLTVEYPPGTVEHVHRHDAYAFVYVLEGSIIEGVRGGKEIT